MGERKVLNKYYPPDFDPAKLPRGQKGDKNQQMKVRMMLAMSVRCGTCGNYMYKGTKFTMRMEDVVGEEYLGIRIFRFYFHCKSCAAEITMKTDPKNSDYQLEHGATRNYEPWRNKDLTVMEAVAKREEEEKGNAMKALENRTQDSKVEMDIMDALEELQALSGRHGRVDTEAALAALHSSSTSDEATMDAEDDAALRAIFQKQTQQVRRIEESRSATDTSAASSSQQPGHSSGSASQPRKPKPPPPRFAVRPKITVQTKRLALKPKIGNAEATIVSISSSGLRIPSAGAVASDGSAVTTHGTPTASGGNDVDSSAGLGGLLGGYGSSGNSEGNSS